MDDVRLGKRFRVLRHRLRLAPGRRRREGRPEPGRHLAGRMRPHRGRVRPGRLRRHALRARCRASDRVCRSGRASSTGVMDEGHAALGRRRGSAARGARLGGPAGGLVRGLSRTRIDRPRRVASGEQDTAGHRGQDRAHVDRGDAPPPRREGAPGFATIVAGALRLATSAVARLLVLPDATTPRRQVRRHEAVLRTALSAARAGAARVASCAVGVDRRAGLSATYERVVVQGRPPSADGGSRRG